MQETADEIVASVLATAGPRVSGPEYSTRGIAELTGLSQPLVSRAVRRIREAEPSGGSPSTPETGGTRGLRLAAVQVAFPLIRITFEESPDPTPRRPRLFARRAAALTAGLWVSGAAEWPASEAPADHRCARTVETQAEDEAVSAVPAHRRVAEWHPGAGSWQTFLAELAGLLDRCAPTEDSIPGDLLRHLAVQADRGLHGLDWSRSTTPSTLGDLSKTRPDSDSDEGKQEALSVTEYPAPGRSPSNRWLPRVGLSATEQIAVALRKEMTTSGFRAGDRLPVRPLAATLGLSQTTVRTAMRQLADDGLLIHAPGGFRVPSVTGTDVIDLYAARLHVGMVILRACATQSRHRLLPARLALARLEASAARGTQADVGEADLRFQQELAEASGLAQSARSFHALTLRVRMFISVLRLDYSPAVDRLVSDGRRLLTAVLESEAEEAVQIWRSKLDHAVRHMSALSPDTFDAGLWARLSR